MSADRNIESGKVKLYSKSILECAHGDRDKILLFDTQLRELVQAYYVNKKMAIAFAEDTDDVSVRYELAAKVFETIDGDIRPIVVTMAVRGDIPLVSRISEAYTELAEQELNAVIVDVVTVVELDDHLRDVIGKKLKNDFGKDAIIREHIDPKIIGGITMSAHGRRVDASIASQLEVAREALTSTSTGGER